MKIAPDELQDGCGLCGHEGAKTTRELSFVFKESVGSGWAALRVNLTVKADVALCDMCFPQAIARALARERLPTGKRYDGRWK